MLESYFKLDHTLRRLRAEPTGRYMDNFAETLHTKGSGTIFAVLFSFILVNALRRAPLPLNPTSPVSYGLVCASLVFAALVAMIGHARRAARIQPLVALREE